MKQPKYLQIPHICGIGIAYLCKRCNTISKKGMYDTVLQPTARTGNRKFQRVMFLGLEVSIGTTSAFDRQKCQDVWSRVGFPTESLSTTRYTMGIHTLYIPSVDPESCYTSLYIIQLKCTTAIQRQSVQSSPHSRADLILCLRFSLDG